MRGVFLSLWSISWFGIIAGFLGIGLEECRTEAVTGHVSHFSVALFTTTVLLWSLFYVCDEKARRKAVRHSGAVDADRYKNWQALVLLSTLAGTILAVFTLMGIAFFVYVAPRIH